MAIDSYSILILWKKVLGSSYLAELISALSIPSAKSLIEILHVTRSRMILWAEMLLLKNLPSKTMFWVEFSYSSCIVFTVVYAGQHASPFIVRSHRREFQSLTKLSVSQILILSYLSSNYVVKSTNMLQHWNLKLLDSLHLCYQYYQLCCPCTKLMSETRALNNV